MPKAINVEYNLVPQRPLTIFEKYQIAEILSQYPALTLKVIMHRKVGLRRAEPMHLWFMAGILFIVGSFLSDPLRIFSVIVLIAGYRQHLSRWKELRRGDEHWHTYNDGISPLEDFLVWLCEARARRQQPEEGASKVKRAVYGVFPDAAEKDKTSGQYPRYSAQWWLSDYRVYRFLEPTLAYIIGGGIILLGWLLKTNGLNLATYAARTVIEAQAFRVAFFGMELIPLGIWICFAAICLAADQRLIYRHDIKNMLDTYDAMMEMATARGLKQKKSGGRVPPSRRKSHGLPVGLDTDLIAAIETRAEQEAQRRERAEQRKTQKRRATIPDIPLKPAPDNLVRSEPMPQPEPAQAVVRNYAPPAAPQQEIQINQSNE